VNEFIRGGARHDRAGRRGFWTPAVDMYEHDGTITVIADLPGFSKDDVQVEVEIKHNQLTLKGERKTQTDMNQANYHRVERVYGTFQRSIRLPAVIDVDKAEAIFKDGVLKLMLQKAAEAKPKPISITP
jgi:HSP20 family protein